MDRRSALDRLCTSYGIVAVYLFGSRGDDGLRLLEGGAVAAEGSDVDIGVAFRRAEVPEDLASMDRDLAEVFEPLHVDLVPLDRVDALFQYRAINGHRIAAPDSRAADLYELAVMRLASELLPVQRRLEREMFGTSTT